MNVKLSQRAQHAISRIDARWQKSADHRDGFRHEMAAAVTVLETSHVGNALSDEEAPAFEAGAAAEVEVSRLDGLELRVLPLARILVSKRAANRAKDRAQIPALEAALAVQRDGGGDLAT